MLNITLLPARFVLATYTATRALKRSELLTVAEIQGLVVTHDRFGTPRAVDGADLGECPWIALQFAVFGARLQTEAEYLGVLDAECPATPSPEPAPELHHVADEPALPEQGIAEALGYTGCVDMRDIRPVAPAPKPAPVAAKPQALHPLRGYVVTQKSKVCEAMKRLYKVGLDRVRDVQVFAKLLAKHLKADVRVRVVNGVTWLLVKKGGSAKAFQF